ncbi:hypothetical protein [Rhizobium jaguaris]|uniref:Uncharacterized protein n=1 Tax=Rhizobium jaguaris TaxID=1312183 RepID=A0A387G2U2_9HYPH|nr:hypothetical protein [Rhizobium jaguaris]AYG61886.1 hypothetical protein CCGE525_23760 [Rhizobium jaguaris]
MTDASSSSVSVSDTSGTAYQNSSTYLFVPGALGKDSTVATDDSSTPGSYFRLGSYSDMETGAQKNGANRALFFPRDHVKDETSNGSQSVGKGILLACNGRLLMRSSDQTYLHSTGSINIDTEDKLNVHADKDILVTSNETITIQNAQSKAITIIAGNGQGNLTTKGLQATIEINGNEFKSTTSDSFSYYRCNVYTYKLGGMVDVTLGGKFSYWLGDALSITTSIDLTISLSIAMTLYVVKVDIGLIKVDFVRNKYEMKEGKFVAAKANFFIFGAKAETTVTKADETAVSNETKAVDSGDAGVQTWVKGVVSKVSGPDSEISEIKSTM